MKLLLKSALLLFTCTAALFITQDVSGQAGGPIPLVQLLPEETQGYIQVADLPEFVKSWNKTQLGILGNDPQLAPFWKAQREEIQKRFADAGWQLNLKAEELNDIATGQAGIAWVAQPGNPNLPYAVCLVMDIAGKDKEAKTLLDRAGQQLLQRGATSKDTQVAGTTVREYTLPVKAGERRLRSSLYALTGGQLFATDDIALLSNLINASKKGAADKPLEKEKLFVDTTGKLSKDEHDLQYFIRPIGFAKALRSFSGRPASGGKDILKVLENQGFSAISAVAGRVRFHTEKFDLQHEAFVTVNSPRPEAVQLLDFPNTASFTLPGWVSDSASSVASFAWNAKDAFWKVRSIVDEVAGREGTFDEVIQSIQDDPLGPQIDVRNQVLPFLTNQIFIVTDTVTPITVNSRRALIAIEVNDPKDELSKVLERAMENEPDAKPMDHKGHRLWKVERGSEDLTQGLENDFGDFNPSGDKTKKKDGTGNDNATEDEQEAPLLNNWAIAKFDKYLFFASGDDVIKEAIDAALAGKVSEFLQQDDVRPAAAALNPELSKCAWRIIRVDRSFEMQYELFRTGQLQQNQSILSTILDRLVRAREQDKAPPPKVNGALLPPYANIKQFLLPVGYSAETTDEGWSFKVFILAP